jgi:hypothetical protein
MFKTKTLASILLVTMIVFAQVGTVLAAPAAQETTTITGTIEKIEPQTDANGETTVLVTLVGGQTVRISVETAAGLNLLVLDPDTNLPVLDPVTNLPVVDDTKVGQSIEIASTDVIPDEEPVEEDVHPISTILAAFFGEEASVIDGYHTDGFGFGVIAQALWMSKNLTDDASLTEQILTAKREGSGTFTLSDGTEITYTNWGQLKKALLEKKNNLGNVVSGHADQDDLSTQQEHGNSKNNAKDHGRSNGKGKSEH